VNGLAALYKKICELRGTKSNRSEKNRHFIKPRVIDCFYFGIKKPVLYSIKSPIKIVKTVNMSHLDFSQIAIHILVHLLLILFGVVMGFSMSKEE
jgi:hypothetical protein